MKVIVTGGAGFIGANLCRVLSTRPGVESVVAIDDLSTGSKENISGVDGVSLVEGSILDRDLLGEACRGAAAVVHLAARPSVPRSMSDPVASHLVNATGTVNVLEIARAVGDAHVVVASSSSVYGANPTLPKSETLKAAPLSPYAASKLAAESYALAWQHSFGLPVLALRFFNVYGPLQTAGHAYAAVIPAFVSAALRGKALQVNGDGAQTRDFTYVSTVAEVIADAIDRQVTHAEPVNLAYGSRRTLLEVIDELQLLVGPVRVEHQAPRVGDVRDSQADSSVLEALFPDVEPTAFRTGLEETVGWFRSGGHPMATVAEG